MPLQKTLVLGAGELGMAVLRSLATQTPDAHLTVLLRPTTIASTDHGKQRDIAELQALGIHLLPGDLAGNSADTLATLFASFDTVIGCTGFVTGSSIQRKLATAVLTAGVRRYVPWQFGVDYDVIGRGSAQNLFDEQLDVRDLLRAQSRTAWLIVSTGMFTSFLFEPSFGVVDLERNTVHALGDWDNAVTVTTPVDIGMLTAAILATEPQLANQVVYTGGDTITYAHLADIVDEAYQRKMKRVLWTVEDLKAALEQDPTDTLKKYRVVFAEGRGVAWPMAQTFNAQHNLATVDVAQWLHAHRRETP